MIRKRRLEGPVAVAQQHADIVARTKISGYQYVELVVVVKVRYGEPLSSGKGIVVAGSLEGSIAIAQQHADVWRIDNGQIRLLVIIKIPHHHKIGTLRGIGINRPLKSAI